MKKITEQEFSSLLLKGNGRSTRAHTAVMNLKAGEAGIIEKKEWRQKKSPSSMVRRIEKKTGMKFLVIPLADNSGWAVKRIS